MSTERRRDTSLHCLLLLGLKSHSWATFSHSVPGVSSLDSFTNASSDALKVERGQRFSWLSSLGLLMFCSLQSVVYSLLWDVSRSLPSPVSFHSSHQELLDIRNLGLSVEA